MGDDGSWRTQAFRQSVVSKIDEAIRQSGMNTSRNSLEMENHVFQKAKSKEEYLGYVARLILHVREMNTKKGAGMGVPGANQGAPGVPDPINALQTLAIQGTRNPLMTMGGSQQAPMGAQQQITATNLLQTLNRGPGQAMSNMQQTMQPRPNMGMGPNSGPLPNQINNQMSQMSNQMPNQMTGQIGNQMPNNGINQMPNQIASQMQGPVQNQIGNQMTNQLSGQIQMGGPMQGPMGSQIPNQMMGQIQGNKPGTIMMNAPNAGFPRNSTPNQFLRQSPSPSVQSPAGLSGPPPSNQMVASPALAPSPSSQMSLLGAGGPPRSVGMVPSPGSSLNTPGQPNQSPMGMQDEQAYREKVRQLSKYIEPLRKMIARMGNDGEHVEKLSKMKKLLEILSNPQQRMPLETLKKCEVVLEKLDFKRSDGSVPTSTTAHLPSKEQHVFNPLLEAVNNNLQSSVINHTLHRTFGPTLEALFGPEIKLVPPLKKMRTEEPTSEIPDVLQGEIARLDQRFKVSLDPNQQPGSKSIQLTCWLDDKQLPCVPPISLVVPEDYPKSAPSCHMAAHEYNATQFLSAVQTALVARIKKLPKYFSVSQLLDTW
jgi:mediator of RNA polymerase II transcription subunit 15